METLTLKTGQCFRNENQPRQFFDPEKINELANSIAIHGQLQPIKVRPAADGRYMIVLGERRWRACTELGIKVQAIVDSELRDDALAEQAIIENLQRLNVTPLEEAKAFQARLDTGIEIDALAQRLGVRPSFIRKRLELLKLETKYQHALDNSEITIGQANQLARLSKTGQRQLFNLITDGKIGSYKNCVAVADAILKAESAEAFSLSMENAQVDAFSTAHMPTKATQKQMKSVERDVFKLFEYIQRVFGTDNNPAERLIAFKENPHAAQKLATDLDYASRHLLMLKQYVERVIH